MHMYMYIYIYIYNRSAAHFQSMNLETSDPDSWALHVSKAFRGWDEWQALILGFENHMLNFVSMRTDRLWLPLCALTMLHCPGELTIDLSLPQLIGLYQEEHPQRRQFSILLRVYTLAHVSSWPNIFTCKGLVSAWGLVMNVPSGTTRIIVSDASPSKRCQPTQRVSKQRRACSPSHLLDVWSMSAIEQHIWRIQYTV